MWASFRMDSAAVDDHDRANVVVVRDANKEDHLVVATSSTIDSHIIFVDDGEIACRSPTDDVIESTATATTTATKSTMTTTNRPLHPPASRIGGRGRGSGSAHMSVLGNVTDRADFFSSGGHVSHKTTSMSTPDDCDRDNGALAKIGRWLGSTSTSTSSPPGHGRPPHPRPDLHVAEEEDDDDDDDDDDDANGRGYRAYASSSIDGGEDGNDDVGSRVMRANVNRDDDAGGGRRDDDDRDDGRATSLLGGNARGRRCGTSTTTTTTRAGRLLPTTLLPSSSSSTIIEEEERIMDECSFFYYSNMDGGMTDDATSRRDRDARGDCDDNMRDVQTRARRMWTERRYRRRLGQSMPTYDSRYHMYDNDDEVDDDSAIMTTRNNIDYHRNRRIRRLAHESAGGNGMHIAEEDRRAFVAAHHALNGDECQFASSTRGSGRIGPEYDIDYDLELAERDGGDASDAGKGDGDGGGGPERLVYRSSLSMRGGLIRLPADNVRLVCDPWLQPGILSIEARDVPGKDGNDNVGRGGGCGKSKYDNVDGGGGGGNLRAFSSSSSQDGGGGRRTKRIRDVNRQRRRRACHRNSRRDSSMDGHSRRRGLAYVLTVDVRIYQRVVQEMGDSYRIPCGMYYCCHVTATGGNYVDIGVAVAILSMILILVIAGMIAWGMD